MPASLGHVPRNYFRDLSAAPQAGYFGHRAILARQTRRRLRETLCPEMAFASTGGRLLTG